MTDSFTWRDGERLIRFAAGAVEEAPALLAERGFGGYTLLTSDRTEAAAPAVVAEAASVVHVPPGTVDVLSAALLGLPGGGGAAAALRSAAREGPLVALGGGRVVDTAKAIGGATARPVATLATTLSGAELTRSHRRPVGMDDAPVIRPSLVIADPKLMTSQPHAMLAASAMNAMAHAMEVLYTPYANPVSDMAALRGATLLAAGVTAPAQAADASPAPHADPSRARVDLALGADASRARVDLALGADASRARVDLALGAVLAGYASGAAGIAVHHAICQTIVRTAGAPHAETNAVMLPHSARMMVTRAPAALGALAGALGDPAGDPDATPGLLAGLAARSGHARLRTLGVDESHVDPIVAGVLRHPLLALSPDPPGADELGAVIRAAL